MNIRATACRRAADLFEKADGHDMSDAYDTASEERHSAYCLAEFGAVKHGGLDKLNELIERELKAAKTARTEEREWQHRRAAGALTSLRDAIWPAEAG